MASKRSRAILLISVKASCFSASWLFSNRVSKADNILFLVWFLTATIKGKTEFIFISLIERLEMPIF